MPKTLYIDTQDGYLRSGIVRFHEALAPLMVPIDSVQPHPENNNNGDEDIVRESILVNGMYNAVKVQVSSGYICAGNTTWAVCKDLGAEGIPVIPLMIDNIEALSILLADNLTAAAAMRDDALTVEVARKIVEARGDTEGIGITMAELDAIEAKARIPLDYAPDPYEGWPTLSAQVSPATFKAFMEMTDGLEDDSNRARFEMLMKMAGWEE